MNILYASESFPPQVDGVAVCTENYAKIIEKKYGKSYVLVPEHKNRVEDDFSFELIQCPSANMKIVNQYKICLPMPLKLKNEVGKLPLDLVHTQCPFLTGLISMKIAKQKNIPHISTFHSKYKDDINQRLKINMELPGEVVAKYVASFYNKCDYVWTVSQGTAKTLKEYGYKGEATIMPNGCDMPITYSDENVRAEIAGRYGVNPSDPILLFVGRLTYVKNVDLIVESIGALKRRGKKLSILMVGSGEDEKKLKQLIIKLGVEDMVKLTGKILDRQELRKIYSSSDLFVFPSVYDNAPLVVREAAACGLPSLLIKGSNSAEGIKDGENGILAEERVEDISLAINEALNNADLKRIGEKARQTVYISWEDVVERVYMEYEKIVKEYRKSKGDPKSKGFSLYDIDLEKELNINLSEKIKDKFKSFKKRYKTG